MALRLPERSLPDAPARWSLLAACSTAAGVALQRTPVLAVPVAVALAWLVVRNRLAAFVVCGFVVAGLASGAIASARIEGTASAELPDGTHTIGMRVAEDATSHRYGTAVGEITRLDDHPWHGPRIAIIGLDATIAAGSSVTATGEMIPGTRRVRDEIVAGRFVVADLLAAAPSRNPLFAVGNAARRRVHSVFDGRRRADGLTAGLLIGDTRLLSAHDSENLRRAGLAHFVAVSGSNVAVFLLAWWVVTAPLAVRPATRALAGVVGLGVFLVVTRWEASVVRASVMAAVPLMGSLVGVPVDVWMALGVAVTGLLLVSADILWSVGFQLSVAATVGVLVGAGVVADRRPRWLWTSLAVTIGAQLAVAPIILAVFGTMPLLAPLANLVAAPVVTMATVTGGVALLAPPLAAVADAAASVVLVIAGRAAMGPQLGWLGVGAALVVGGLMAWRTSRPLGVAAALLIVMTFAATPPDWPTVPTLVALDVGQGDAILVQDPSGAALLVDGGHDPFVVDRALRRHGVARLDVVIATHGDADHVGGLASVVTSFDVGELWVSAHAGPSDLLQDVVDAATDHDVEVRRVEAGDRMRLGSTKIEVVAPARRFKTDNDGSIVTLATAERTALMPGDVERIGQAELPTLRPDVIVVPHHGSASSDPDWIRRTVGDVAILSYGPNRYGHPDPGIVSVLEATGADVRETFIEGDVVVPLAGNG